MPSCASGSPRRSISPALLLALVLLLSNCGSAVDGRAGPEELTTMPLDRTEPEQVDADLRVARPDLTASGNRVADGVGSLHRSTPTDIALPASAQWLHPVIDNGEIPRWFAELDDGRTVLVDTGGVTPLRSPNVTVEPADTTDLFTDPLPDGRVVAFGDVRVALVGPTDRYPHGVLGDRIEAGAMEVLHSSSGERQTFGPAPPTVIEGISAILFDPGSETAEGGGRAPEILVTQSNADVGAWLALWSIDGRLLAESAPIGQGNRWRNQLAVAPIGPNGEMEFVDVRTPHLGGTVEFFRRDGSELVVVASRSGYTSHRIGSRNLDLGIVADADGNGQLDVVVPTNDRTGLGILRRIDSGDGVEVVATVPLSGRLSTNVSAATDGTGGLWFAAGSDDNTVRIWAGP